MEGGRRTRSLDRLRDDGTGGRDAVAPDVENALADEGISLTPLMLVQVDSTAKSVERAKDKLLKLGFKESQIAVHTAAEPDAGLMAPANDETREVLIFKMAVALGFDAPRAWTLVSMRATKDPDFGVQLVGRILRVHRRLQGRKLPELLRYGYVLFADAAGQTGIDVAGQRINQLQTAYAKVSPTTVVVQVAGRSTVNSWKVLFVTRSDRARLRAWHAFPRQVRTARRAAPTLALGAAMAAILKVNLL